MLRSGPSSPHPSYLESLIVVLISKREMRSRDAAVAVVVDAGVDVVVVVAVGKILTISIFFKLLGSLSFQRFIQRIPC
jgi:hypothetical protein